MLDNLERRAAVGKRRPVNGYRRVVVFPGTCEFDADRAGVGVPVAFDEGRTTAGCIVIHASADHVDPAVEAFRNQITGIETIDDSLLGFMNCSSTRWIAVA